MSFESQGGNEKKSECRALVSLAGQETISINSRWLSAAPFVVQLAANVKGFAVYRAKRRADPADGTHSYRVAAARVVARPRPGNYLNYCA